MKTKINGILALLMAFMVQITFAQERVISGVVSDDLGPVADISVKVKNTDRGTATDFDGNYSIKAKTGETLVFTHISYKTVEMVVGSSSRINATMKESGESLKEIVIIGAYDIKRTKPKTNIASTTVSVETIENRPNASLVQTLQGQVAGLEIISNSGQPGASSSVIIRGQGSLGGKVSPLYVVDGVPLNTENFRSFNENDIASVSILKDAGATAIYGNRGANGAIIITTKSGKFSSPLKVTYSLTSSFNHLQGNNYNLMNAKEQLELERLQGVGRGAGMTDAEISAVAKYSNTDWEKVFFRSGYSQTHNLSLSNGGKRVRSFTSFSFFDQEGILKQSDLKRFSVRNNLDGKSENEKFTYGTNVTINYSKSNTPNSIGSGAVNRNYILGAYQSVPYISPHDYTPGDANIPVVFANTPLFLLNRLDTYTRYVTEIKILGTIKASYKILDNLTFNTRLSSEFNETQLVTSESPTSFNAVLFAPPAGFQDQNTIRETTFDFVNSLNYTKTFNDKHTLDVGVYTEYIKGHRNSHGFRANGLTPSTFYPGDGSGFISDNGSDDFNVDTINADLRTAGLFSYFANIDYDFNSKYGVGATIRRDASFRFRETNRWGTFYSVTGRWNLDKENFVNSDVFNLLKLRASYGILGNQDVANTGFFFTDSKDQDLYSSGAGYAGQNALHLSQVGYTKLKWEETSQVNIGLDFNIKKLFYGSLDVYNKETLLLFTAFPTPYTSGTGSLDINSPGLLRNKGVELGMHYDFFKNNDDFNLTVNFVGAYNKSERFRSGLSTIREGGPLGEVYTYRYAGVNPENGHLLFLDINDNLTETPDPEADRVFTNKKVTPDYQGSFGFDMDYKGFFLSTAFNYIIGSYRYDFDYSGFVDPSAIGQFRHSRDILRAWTPTNRNTDIPALNAPGLSTYTGDRFLFNSDYLRLRNVTFGYNVPQKHLTGIKAIGLKSAKAFFTGENLVTFTGWRGNDAEGFDEDQNRYPTPRIISLGLVLGF